MVHGLIVDGVVCSRSDHGLLGINRPHHPDSTLALNLEPSLQSNTLIVNHYKTEAMSLTLALPKGTPEGHSQRALPKGAP
ncbi:hypothetical protein HaLaN_08246 [Haematococcus lacustris]|uniref:Uncharacterized protein n=1 Tax=Haematococcus lacustris TaxID=44745 RepID=A0A699YQC6_HAELA|nr:hypothetical protein HaLaN_08246 [Haematococcus lacustris]